MIRDFFYYNFTFAMLNVPFHPTLFIQIKETLFSLLRQFKCFLKWLERFDFML